MKGLLGMGVAALVSLLAGPVASGAAENVPGPKVGNDTPVVLIILDELPTANLMTADGKRIDGRRFSQIANFAKGSTWYRDHATNGDFTAWAVPSILAGEQGDMYTLPTSAGYPYSIFTLIGPGRTVHSLEPLTEICPAAICPDGRQGEVTEARHAVDFIKQKYRPFVPAEIHRWTDSLPSGRDTLSVVHVGSPHQPLRFIPEGKVYPGGPLAMPTELEMDGWVIGESGVSFVQQRHLIQSGYADRLVGRILRKIKSNGDYDQAMIVLTADHGVSFDPDDLRRDATATNVGAVANPPLIIKYPDQSEGEVSTVPTQSIDIFATIAGELGVDVPSTDGLPVGEVSERRSIKVNRYFNAPLETTVEEIRADRKGVLADQIRRLGTRDLWHLGPRSYLIGRKPGRVRDLPGALYGLDVSAALIRKADASSNKVPSLISGRLAQVGNGRVIALAWNGRIVATTRTFTYRDKVRFGAMVPPSVMRKGNNRVSVFAVVRGGALRRIRPV